MKHSIAHILPGSLLCLALAVASAAHDAGAASFLDASGDFLPSYTGPKDADLDARFVDVVIDPVAQTITFFATVAGPIDQSSGKFYVFGIDRGRGDAGRDLVFQGPLGGLPKIGGGVRWDAALGVLANGQAIFFDALNPGIVPLPNALVRIVGNELSASVPLSLFPSQGFELKDYAYNFWPRSQVSLANTTVSDFAPDNGDARVGIVGKHAQFALVRSAPAEAAQCLAQARAEVTILSVGAVELMDVTVRDMPPHTDFGVFALQVPNAPFGVSTYQGDIETDGHGRAHQRFVGRFSGASFTVAPGAAPAPVVHRTTFPDAELNPASAPVHQFHLGLWFKSTAAAAHAGCPADVTPFSAEHDAGIQALSTRNFPDLQGPLLAIKP